MRFPLRGALLLVFLLPAHPAAAQLSEGIKLDGHVLVSQTMQPVEGALVELVRRGMTHDRTYTRSRGEFEFLRLVVDEYVVRVRQEGYLPAERTINLLVDSGSRFNVTLLLERDPKAAKPVAAAPLSARELQVPENARDEFKTGFLELNENNQPGKSIPYFEKAIALHKDFDEAYVQLALAHFLMGKRSNALRTLAKAVEVYPQNARAFALMGKVLMDANQPEPGVQALEEALAIDETLWSAHADLAAALVQRKELDRALTHARRAHELNDQAPATHFVLATVLFESKSYGDALGEMNEFLRRFPAHSAAAAIRKQRDEAQRLFREGKSVKPAPSRIRVGGDGPVLLNSVKPNYPPLARQAKIQGTVRLEIVIATEGIIREWQVISGHPLLAEAAVEAVRQWRYRPILLNGEAVEVVTTVDVVFDLKQ